MAPKAHLLLIDPQNDFCDLPENYHPISAHSHSRESPALPVAGAHADMQRAAVFVRNAGPSISEITVTLDSHHRLDIAHPTFWQTAAGLSVAPFTTITAAQLRAGEFAPRNAGALPRAQAYLDELESRGRYTLMVWPVHCQIGSWGHNIHADLLAACSAWEEQALKPVNVLNKGANPWTEHYSAVQAEVPDADDPDTQLNHKLIHHLDQADVLLIAGEASSHCVKATVEHIVAHLPSGKVGKIVLLKDCMSPVGGFEAQHTAFFADMHAKGVQLMHSREALEQIQEKP